MISDELLIIDPFRYQILMYKTVPNPKRFKHNWRTDMLALPKGNKEDLELFQLKPDEIEMYKNLKKRQLAQIEESQSSEMHLKKRINKLVEETTNQLSVFHPRVYVNQKKLYKGVGGKEFEHKMDKLMEKSKNSVYHEYERARKKMKSTEAKARRKSSAQSRKSAKKANRARSLSTSTGTRKSKGGKSKAEAIAAAIEHCAAMALPKKIPKPPRISRGKGGDMDNACLARLITPRHFTPKYVDDSMKTWKRQHYVSEAALTYKPSNRIYELAVHKFIPQPETHHDLVEPNALRAIASPRIIELATPKPRSAVAEADYNEDAFRISPAALTYKATERIIEMAKPIDRK